MMEQEQKRLMKELEVHRLSEDEFMQRFMDLERARRFARLPLGAFVRELSASGYPLHLPQAT